MERPIIGGVVCIKCSGNGRTWLQKTTDIESSRNRFNFSVSINSCLDHTMREEWAKYGNESFSLTVLEEIKKREDRSAKEFSADVDMLYEIWEEKMNNEQ